MQLIFFHTPFLTKKTLKTNGGPKKLLEKRGIENVHEDNKIKIKVGKKVTIYAKMNKTVHNFFKFIHG